MVEPIPDRYALALANQNPYFNRLSEENKKIFLHRLAVFLDSVDFATEPGFIIDREMIIIISSAFIQITFGLDKYTLEDYDHIFIAPRPYSYRGIDKILSGDVNTALKRISLSWPCVQKGYSIQEDAINIAIHEFAHCLTIEHFSGPYLNYYFDNDDWHRWMQLGKEKIEKIRNQENATIRNYAGTNIMEFFAVCLENFFERPELFKTKLPPLYDSLTNLLNQDPIQAHSPVLSSAWE